MTSEQILKSDMLDILFDGRNKAYGAYELRRKYDNDLGHALLVGVLITVSFLAIPTTMTFLEQKKFRLRKLFMMYLVGLRSCQNKLFPR